MIIANSDNNFAIESEISQAYERLSFRAIGFFVIHISGHIYGKRSREASLLACSYDEVGRRIARRGMHVAPFAAIDKPGIIADAFLEAIYADDPAPSVLSTPLPEFQKLIYQNFLMWAPDGDECFDDGSKILQFDINDQVRLIGFRSEAYRHLPDTLSDLWLPADEFYHVLQQWRGVFEANWLTLPKVPMHRDGGNRTYPTTL